MAQVLVSPQPQASPTDLHEPLQQTYTKGLTNEQKFEAYYLSNEGWKRGKIARKLGVSKPTITFLLEGRKQRNQIPFKQILAQDAKLYQQYCEWVRLNHTVFEDRRWDRTDFAALPLIKMWRDTKIRSGSPTMLRNINILHGILTGKTVPGFKCNPEAFTLNLDHAKPSPVKTFVDQYLQQTGKHKLPQHMSIAIRDFLAICHQTVIPRGLGHTYGLSGEKENYGKHNNKMLTNTQWLQLLKTLLQQGNLKLAAKMAVGCEGFPRSETLNKLNPSTFQLKQREIEETLCQYYTFQKFETKTQKHKQSAFTAEIFHPAAIEITKAYLATYKPQTTMFVDGLNPTEIERQDRTYNAALRTIYKQLGITDPYYYDYPTYTCRHTGAKRTVKRCGGNYAIVAKRGWLDTKTLQDCYAGMDEEDDFESKTCYECKPPKYPSVDEERFCSLKCCVLYYTKHYSEITADFTPLIQTTLHRRA